MWFDREPFLPMSLEFQHHESQYRHGDVQKQGNRLQVQWLARPQAIARGRDGRDHSLLALPSGVAMLFSVAQSVDLRLLNQAIPEGGEVHFVRHPGA